MRAETPTTAGGGGKGGGGKGGGGKGGGKGVGAASIAGALRVGRRAGLRRMVARGAASEVADGLEMKRVANTEP